MKRTLLLIAVLFAAIVSKAQQNTLDSLSYELKTHPDEDTVRLSLLNSIAFEYNDVNPQKGLETSEAAIVLAEKIKDNKNLGLAYRNKGLNYHSKGESTVALEWYNKAVAIFKRSGLKKMEAYTYHSIGIAYFDMSEYSKALQMQQQAFLLSKQLNDSLGMAKASGSIGVVYQFMSDYPQALQNQLKALDLFSKLNYTQGMLDAFNNIGLVYLHQENFSKALSYYERSLQLNEQSGNKQSQANVLGNMATAYDNMNDSLHAMNYYKEALRVSEEINYAFGIASNTTNIGVFYYYYSNYVPALAYLKKGLTMYERMNDKNNQSLILNILGNIYAEAPDNILIKEGVSPANRYATAIEYNNKSLVLSRDIGALKRQAFVLESLSNIYEKKNDYKKAYKFYKQLVAVNDSVASNNKNSQITRLELQYEFNKTQDSIKAATDKERALTTAQIQKQRVIKNSLMAGSILLIMAGVFGFIFYKHNRDIKSKKNEAELNAKVTDVEMKALRAQMNPHFIFNSLNSIADYIENNQTKIAANFTAKFAKLMRMVLENSEHKQIPLADDLKALELYMQLESFRMQNKFSYTIHIDDNIDRENTLVPPLILQPFVENSIWHGISKKDGHGSIKIFIKQEGENINCIVEDDGVGITDDLDTKEKTSLGMKITKARIDIINRLKNTNASIRISNKEKGVRAEVELPLVLSF